jgi:cyclohexadienyl dehydratase
LHLIRRLIVLAGLVLIEPTLAQASRLDEILARGVLRVGTTGDYRPFTALDKVSGAYSGFDIDLAQSLGAALGVKIEFEPTS